MSKEEEIEMYTKTYSFAFGKDRSFFFENDIAVICDFLSSNYFFDSLIFKAKLLTTLLYNDALIQEEEIKKNFFKKSMELDEYLKQLPI